jgi:cytochrome c-type biogenesis protein CcmE
MIVGYMLATAAIISIMILVQLLQKIKYYDMPTTKNKIFK